MSDLSPNGHSNDDCRRCEAERNTAWIYQDSLWSVGPMATAPGWLILQVRRHAEGVTALNEQELATLGPLLARVAGALQRVTGAERIYQQAYGENSPHYHIAMIPRGSDIPAEHRGPALLMHLSDYDGQSERAETIAETLRHELGNGKGA